MIHTPTPPSELEQSARDVMDRHAKSFSWAARFLSPGARREANLLYAFARTADDLADEASLGSFEQRSKALSSWCMQAVKHSSEASSLPGIVGGLLERHKVSSSVLLHFTESLRADMVNRRLRSNDELLGFAYGVAGTVGLMMRPILGAPPAGNTYAMALGVAMQLTNIARDVVEDADRGRTYLPLDFEVDANALRSGANTQLRSRVFEQIETVLQMAEQWYAHAQGGIDWIPAENRRAIAVALELYRAIGRKIMDGGAVAYWRGRVHLNTFEKARLIMALAIRKNKPQESNRLQNTGFSLPPGFEVLRSLPGFPQD
jgi:15-cis-phytoene synthase